MQQDELIGTTLGNYRILEPLGQGGMARVYRAHQENLGRDVAIKVLPPWYASDRSFVERFNLEARLVARLSHPNIVTVHDANEQHGHLYIVMQLVDGGTLKHRMDRSHYERRMIDTAEIVHIFTQLADALAYAHEQGVIHRDIKPVNVLMDRSGRPILSDFGIAKVLASTQSPHLTRPGAGVGTPEYMSPEQCQGGPVDGRADIYALGAMLFEAQTGRTPFVGDNYPALAHSHIYENPPRPRALNPAIHPAIEQIILKALLKQPQQRYQTAHEMGEALTQALSTMSSPPPPPPPMLPMAPLSSPTGGGGYYGGQTPIQPGPFLSPQTLNGHNTLANSQQQMFYQCFNCQHLNKPQMRYCTRCGYLLNQCTVCGERNPVGNRFCTKCGQPLIQ
ncbi:MAG TPA: serine/threonine-protein kinase [Dictyobacter sp.]|jgi:serine/threonine-protein kinase|nr:serine/threonine-protein kinase [Dictyobacter sp.]